MLRRMSIRGAVAATCRAALLTGAQVHPAISGFYTLLTNPLLRLLDLSNRVDMNTNLHSHARSNRSLPVCGALGFSLLLLHPLSHRIDVAGISFVIPLLEPVCGLLQIGKEIRTLKRLTKLRCHIL